MAILRREELLKLVVENSRKPASEQKSIRQLILDAGYSEHAADHPSEILDSKSWEEMLEEYVPDSLVLTALKKSLESSGGHVRNQAADIVVKIRGKYAPSKLQVSTDEELSDEELERRIAEKKAEIAARKGQNSSKTDENNSKQDENTLKTE